MLRLRAAAVLLLVAAAWAPLGQAGTADDPELTDAAADQTITRPGSSQIPPIVPGVNDDPFNDIDITAAWFEERTLDCIGEPELDCPRLTLMVKTTSGWTTGTLTGNFTLRRGPTSYATSNASGQNIAFTVQGTTVSGVDNATAAVGPDGLRILLPIPRIGAVGGDVLTGLTLATTRTNLGTVTDPMVTQDDQVGSDAAGPGATYTLERPARVDSWNLRIVSIDGAPTTSVTLTERRTISIVIEVTNQGTDRANVVVHARSQGVFTPAYSGEALQGTLDPREVMRFDLNISMAGMDGGAALIRFYVFDNEPAATATITYAPFAAEREVKPAGLGFLTPAAESTGLDKAFGSYAELALLALIVLLVILAIFLLVALAPSTLAGSAAPEAPPLAAGTDGDAAPAGLLAAPVATEASVAPAAETFGADDAVPAVAAAATAGGALAIESVTHTPDAPEAGEDVKTEVLLRNPGPTRQVRVVLALDGVDIDENAATLPARASKTVRLSWTAGAGENKVRVRVLPA